MELRRHDEVPPVQEGEPVFRLSRLRSSLAFLVLLAGSGLGVAFLVVALRARSVVGGVLASLYVLAMTAILRVLGRALAAIFSARNWSLRPNSAGLWIHLRSPYHDDLPDEDAVAAFLPWSEVVAARLRSERRVVPGPDAPVHQTHWFLDVEVVPRREVVECLRAALAREHERRPPGSEIQDRRRALFQARKRRAPPEEIERAKEAIAEAERRHAGHRTRGRFQHQPVSWTEPATLSIEVTHLAPGRRRLEAQLAANAVLRESEAAAVPGANGVRREPNPVRDAAGMVPGRVAFSSPADFRPCPPCCRRHRLRGTAGSTSRPRAGRAATW